MFAQESKVFAAENFGALTATDVNIGTNAEGAAALTLTGDATITATNVKVDGATYTNQTTATQ